ncbi:succinylglutamate-semialdehyde dehydrogenase [soil metagenome]
METDPQAWSNRSPGDLSRELPEVAASNVFAGVNRSAVAFADWKTTKLDERKTLLSQAHDRLREKQEDLATLIALEVGKPLREARLEMGAVVAKFDLAFADADRFWAEEAVTDGPHPAMVRRLPRGPAAVIAPFNFPIHLGHGAALGYLLAGNTVLFKPSPLAANVGEAYAAVMQEVLPEGVFELVQGWGSVGRALCLHDKVRAVCFTGSVPVGRGLARDLGADYSKSLALELGGKNSLIVCADADLDLAAEAAADGICLTTGQRCNSTSRILVDRKVGQVFADKLDASLERYQPGDPLDEKTMLGPLISEKAVERYRHLTGQGAVKGYFVKPVIQRIEEGAYQIEEEAFCPVATLETFAGPDAVVARHDSSAWGLTASLFTKSEQTFRMLGDQLSVGNLYHNLPTTFSPSALPFGGVRASGNGKPGARGFIRFAADEQAVQWRAQG